MHQTINKINDHNSSCPTQSKLVANGVHRLAIESFHSSIVGTVMGDKVPKVPEPGRQVPEPGRQVPELERQVPEPEETQWWETKVQESRNPDEVPRPDGPQNKHNDGRQISKNPGAFINHKKKHNDGRQGSKSPETRETSPGTRETRDKSRNQKKHNDGKQKSKNPETLMKSRALMHHRTNTMMGDKVPKIPEPSQTTRKNTMMGDKVPKVPKPGRQVLELGRQVPEPEETQWWETKVQESRNPDEVPRPDGPQNKHNDGRQGSKNPGALINHKKKHNDGRQGSKSPETRETSPGTRETSPGTRRNTMMGNKSPRIQKPWWSPAPWWTTEQTQWWETRFQKSRSPDKPQEKTQWWETKVQESRNPDEAPKPWWTIERNTMMGDKVPKVPEPGTQVPEPCASSELGAHARYQSPATRDWNPKAYCCWEPTTKNDFQLSITHCLAH